MSLSHLREHKFKHNFQDTIDPFCSCRLDIETTVHFFLHCQNYTFQRITLMDSLSKIDLDLTDLNENLLTEVLLFGHPKYSKSVHSEILMASISYILFTKRFGENLVN